MKKFVIVPGLKYYFFSDIKNPHIYVEEERFLSDTNTIKVYLQRVSKKLGAWWLYIQFIDDWKIKLKECDKCIIFDQAFSIALIKSIKKINPHINIIIYMWNPTFKDVTITEKLLKVKNLVKVYSFDKNDCNRFGYNFSPMIYNFDINLKNESIDYDVIFVGYLKNRATLLKKFYEKLMILKANCFFYVLDNVNTTEEVPFELHNAYLPYDEYKKKMLASHAVLDIVQDGQVGLTIRTMETICYGKKLITNNQDIKNYDFYNKNNIFIIGLDSFDNLENFIKTPFEPISNEVIKHYNFVDWVQTF